MAENRWMVEAIHEIIHGFNVEGCYAVVDTDGLILGWIGDCPEESMVESLAAHLITSFQENMKKFSLFSNKLKSCIFNVGEYSYYLDDIAGTELYLISLCKENTLHNFLPILSEIIKKVELVLNPPEDLII
ncbi:MAG: hypothetical protein ACFFD4_28820 [Candidatus Odinarchaeota archaeon]